MAREASVVCFAFQILSTEVLDSDLDDMTLPLGFIDHTKLLAIGYLLYQFFIEISAKHLCM